MCDFVFCFSLSSIDDVYGGSNRYFRQVATPSNGMSFSFVDFCKAGELEKAFTEKTKVCSSGQCATLYRSVFYFIDVSVLTQFYFMCNSYFRDILTIICYY